MTSDRMSGPLKGLTVLDLSGMISGGFATMMLADFGADVIMVEHPKKPDPLREWKSPLEDKSLWWKSIGRNKRCITLDLSTEEGREITLKLAEKSDLIFENFRPGTLEKWDLGYSDLKETNEGIILVRLSGYGQTGPLKKEPGFGTIAEGISGWAHANGFPDREPLLPPIPLADLTAAQFAVQSALFAIFERDIGENGGSCEGQVIDVSLYEPLMRMFIGDIEKYDQHNIVRKRTGNRLPLDAPRNLYETLDGYLSISASNQKIFHNVLKAIDKEELIEDPRFESNAARVDNAEQLDRIIEKWTSKHTTDEAVEIMRENDAVAGPIYDVSDIFEDEHIKARNDIIEVYDEHVGEVRTVNTIPKFTRTPGGVSHLGPDHGQHNEEIIVDELDISKERYENLKSNNII